MSIEFPNRPDFKRFIWLGGKIHLSRDGDTMLCGRDRHKHPLYHANEDEPGDLCKKCEGVRDNILEARRRMEERIIR